MANKIEIELTNEQIIDALNFESWNLNDLISVQAQVNKAMIAVVDSPQTAKTEKPQSRTKTKRKTTKYGCKKWSDQDKERLKQRFVKYKGKITEKRLDILARRFKRTPIAVKCQIRNHHKTWLASLVDTTTKLVVKKQKKKQKKSKKLTAWMTKVHTKAHELKEADGHKKKYKDYVVEASKLLQKPKGDAHTQPKEPVELEKKAQREVAFPRIYPLSQQGNDVLRDMMRDLIFKPNNLLTKSNTRPHLQLTEGHTWSESTWINILAHINYAHADILRYFDCPGSFSVQHDNGMKVLRYKKRGVTNG